MADVKKKDKTVHQLIMDGLCDNHCVPRIPVKVCKKLDGIHGDFDSAEYFIRIEENAPIEKLYHEFTHYLIRLINVVVDIEENICDYSAIGITKDLKKNSPLLSELLKKRKV